MHCVVSARFLKKIFNIFFMFDSLRAHFHFGISPHISVVVTYLYLRTTQKLCVHEHAFSFGDLGFSLKQHPNFSML